MNIFSLAAFVLVVEGFAGYPPALFRHIGHPVQWIGKLISYLDDGLNDEDAEPHEQKNAGMLAVLALCLAVGVPAFALQKILTALPYGWIFTIIIATVFIAQKSLRDHVSDVEKALSNSLDSARQTVSKIVGRDTSTLDESSIAKAALESLAENTADGIVAPLFWFCVAGLPGLIIYKAINTADSMIGHKSEKYLHFGWATAKLDDLINLPASRLTGLLFAASAGSTHALQTMWRDAGKHQSPNAGWPEAAMAGALHLKFGGPRNYEGEIIELATMGDGREILNQSDINRGLNLFDRAMLLLLLSCVALAIVL